MWRCLQTGTETVFFLLPLSFNERDRFAKTGSGQTCRKTSFEKDRLLMKRQGNVFFQDAVNITVSGVSITESAGWSQIYRRVSHLLARALVVTNSVQWGTGDGMVCQIPTPVNISTTACQIQTGWSPHSERSFER